MTNMETQIQALVDYIKERVLNSDFEIKDTIVTRYKAVNILIDDVEIYLMGFNSKDTPPVLRVSSMGILFFNSFDLHCNFDEDKVEDIWDTIIQKYKDNKSTSLENQKKELEESLNKVMEQQKELESL